MAAPGGGNIKVVVRVRPFNSREKDRNAKCIVSMKGSQTVLSPPPPEPGSKGKAAKGSLDGAKTFAFDKSYWSFNRKDSNFADQEDLFTDLGKPLLDNAFQGYNNCIFAYGQTGSGKSYSMMGYGPEEGVIPRICRDMFDRIDTKQQDKNVKCTVEVSYLEIYNERVRDLLNPSTKGNLKVREHPSTGPYVEDLAKLVVGSFSEIDHLMDEGNKARTVAATNMNETSSRSHAVFTLTLTQKRHDDETNMDTEKVAKISLVDLAGSERATSTGATGARLKEGAEINRSLSTLGRVIAALADMSSPKAKAKGMQVPYRDSVLTWLLKDSLGGNSLTAMIAAISPADINFEETLSTLRYADSAKRIKNHAVVNEDPNARMIRELKEELAQLRSKLSTGGSIAEEQYSPDTPLEKQIVSITQPDGSIKKVSKAEIAEQLSQSEKLYKDLNQTWEEKMKKTDEIHKEREAALEELGISIEKGNVGLSTPKKMPHLVNLSDDPLLAECLVYNLKPGTTTVGNVETDEEEGGESSNTAQSAVDIRLNGSKILHDHCTFENVDGVVTVVPKDGAAVMVNGLRIEAPKRLRSGYRVILGDFHIFRFNHPQEAREERAEQGSLLKYSVTADQLASPSPKPPGHERTMSSISQAWSEDPREFSPSPGMISPVPFKPHGRDTDWAFARREAISAIMGPDQKMSNLTDDELDILFDDLQRVRAGRRGRPDSRILNEGDTDTESVASHPIREKYLSNGTLDNFSLDTALTMPSTPRQVSEDGDRLKQTRDEMQEQLEKQKEEFQQKLQADEDGTAEIEEMRAEKAKMEASLLEMKQEMQAKLEKELADQKKAFEKQLATTKSPPRPSSRRKSTAGGLSEIDIILAKKVAYHWRRQRYVAMAAAVLKNASMLKEAQVMSQQMDRHVVFQFTVIDVGHTFGSSYDLVLNGVSAEDSNDPDLEDAIKPCLGVRVIDFGRSVIHLWSLAKLQTRVKTMRQMHAYIDRPDYLQHFCIESPFEEPCMPEYTRVGDADIPLAAVFECRVQDFTLDVYSPYTNSVVGIVRLSLEPSSAEAPSSTLKFNVVMHDLVGFAEREGTNVHAQLFIPGISEEGGATTTTLITGFEEGPVKFESVHSMSLPLSAPHTASLRVSIFAQVTGMHLDKLLSWDDMRDASSAATSGTSSRRRHRKRKQPRLSEREYYTEERHDVFARVQVLEIGENGEYQPVEVVQAGTLDQGAYQLHQGLQRRISLTLTHNSGESLPWHEVTGFRAGSVRLVDADGKVASTDLDNGGHDIPLPLVSPPVIRNNPDGTAQIKMVGQWDSSAHGSLLLDRPAAVEKYRVQLSLKWQISSPRVTQPMTFTYDFAVQTRPRSWFRQNSLLAQLWHNQRVVRSSAGSFSVVLKPSAAKRVGDLWRMDTREVYVTGQEGLSGWAPRSVSLIRDFVELKKRQVRTAEIESAKGLLSLNAASPIISAEQTENGDFTERQKTIIEKMLDLWQHAPKSTDILLLQSDLESPGQLSGTQSVDTSEIDVAPASDPPLSAVVDTHTKTPSVLKAGWLLSPDPSGTRWIRRYVELRRPYLHLYSSEGDEVNAINLTNSRIDADPQIAMLLQRDNVSLEVWAVYATNKAWLFACRNDRERGEWIWAVDRSYVSGGSSGHDSDSDD
ncbi:kinesin-like protein [Acrodontium crateriforme]|uniref:Kinesin-like protein n=1 Tax=Acrodontium crateriforme TaxID=150365 RepID=A0AAQ3LWJ1_9PEZI|nr:kinesin-like protein [Acrodontium crateriforme]